ncbi:unnamed protein product [Zymoseptoria tritici ST99CH_3D1]|nr:unnamed protein product [Zymoseptoria tritici ST99CH_3D1]
MDPGATTPSSSCTETNWFLQIFNCPRSVEGSSPTTIGALVAALAVSFASLGGQTLIFTILRLKLTRIYRPKSYLVPERERVPPPPGGIIGWIYPLWTTSNLTLIQKCGLDAYFFLRYLRMLLKIFFPMAILCLPVLLPINNSGGNGLQGLDKLTVANIIATKGDRLWTHLVLAIIFIGWLCYVVFMELRGYIRVRQAYLTSPQHRIRASATTVLVTGIPRKWLTLEALSGLYDVFPGGIRNIWINRNYDALAEKVSDRESIAKSLENAETNLIKKCREKHAEAEKKRAKKEGYRTKSKEQLKQDKADEDAAAERLAEGQGVSAGAHHETQHGMQDILDEDDRQEDNYTSPGHKPRGFAGKFGQGIGNFGKGVTKFGGRVVGDFDTTLHKAGTDLNRNVDVLNTGGIGGGFVVDDSLYDSPAAQRSDQNLRADGLTGLRKPGQTAKQQLDGANNERSQMQARPRNDSSAIADARGRNSSNSDDTLGGPHIRMTRPSADEPRSTMETEKPQAQKAHRKPWNFLKNQDNNLVVPSPQPHQAEGEDGFPLHHGEKSHSEDKQKDRKKKDVKSTDEEYDCAFDEEWDEDQDEEPYWRRYIEPKDRETMRLPLFSPGWFPALPLVGKKVDRIYHLRRELARLNLEIEEDQNNPDKFPYMNSAFIQFNHQIAAHMCCQSLSHHIPQQMAPRIVEISPDDVIWDNMSIKWWERYLRTFIVLLVCAGLIILYAVPVALTGLISSVGQLATFAPWLRWLNDAPKWVISAIEGILPPLLLALILALVPVIFRLMIQQKGVATGNAKEMGVQTWYFAFLFIQVFFVVTLSTGFSEFVNNFANNPGEVVETLGKTLPQSSNYFFTYLTVQALSNSASNLLQTGSLFGWFILAPLLDSTARAKWKRQTELNRVQWGSFFPPFTNFAVIGIIYSILSPLILVFMLLIFGLFWIVYRYNVLFVYQFKNDTGGLLFPVAINQLFVGVYFLEVCLIGIFFTTIENGTVVTLPQGIIMILVLVATVGYQILMNSAFNPLFQYLPITLEDEAVIRDEEFARAQASKFAPLTQQEEQEAEDPRDIQDVLERKERNEHDQDVAAEDSERRNIEEHRRPSAAHPTPSSSPNEKAKAWYHRTEAKPAALNPEKWKHVGPEAVARLRYLADGKPVKSQNANNTNDPESQKTVGDVLFAGYADELEDLTPDERDLLVRFAFQHSALRAKRPVVWIPRDTLGVSDDEIRRAKKMSTVRVGGEGEERVNIWMSNEGTALDGKGRVVFRRSPPDFRSLDLIAL